jgi:hypothetical protein
VTLRTGHGKGAGTPRIEVLPADELPIGTPGERRPPSPESHTADGRFAPGNALASQGGKARAGATRLADRLGIDGETSEAFAPYHRAAVSFRRAQCAALAASVGAGACGPGPSSLVATAALQLAWSRYFSDQAAKTGDAKLAATASKLGNDSRQNLLAAHELCAREGKARPAVSPHAALMAALEGDGEETTDAKG